MAICAHAPHSQPSAGAAEPAAPDGRVPCRSARRPSRRQWRRRCTERRVAHRGVASTSPGAAPRGAAGTIPERRGGGPGRDRPRLAVGWRADQDPVRRPVRQPADRADHDRRDQHRPGWPPWSDSTSGTSGSAGPLDGRPRPGRSPARRPRRPRSGSAPTGRRRTGFAADAVPPSSRRGSATATVQAASTSSTTTSPDGRRRPREHPAAAAASRGDRRQRPPVGHDVHLDPSPAGARRSPCRRRTASPPRPRARAQPGHARHREYRVGHRPGGQVLARRTGLLHPRVGPVSCGVSTWMSSTWTFTSIT